MNIHIVSDSPKTKSGFSRVASNLALGLSKLGHDVSMTGLDTYYESEWLTDDNIASDNDDDIEVMPAKVQYTNEITKFMMNIKEVNPDIVLGIMNGDDAQQNQYTKVVKPFVWYVPVEGRNISDMMINDLKQVGENGGKIVAQCLWGQAELANHGIKSTCIYHGYDPGVFQKTDDTKVMDTMHVMTRMKTNDLKWSDELERVENIKQLIDGRFVFGFVGANHGLRKRIERLIKAYALLLEHDDGELRDNTVLVLKTFPSSISGINLIKKCDKYHVGENVLFLFGHNNILSDKAMNVIYNQFDVNCSCSGSEGFGFPTIESMACGVAQISPACSSFLELIGKERGKLVSKGEWHVIPDESERFLVSERAFSEEMYSMYNDDHLRKWCGKNAEKWAKQYTWDNIVKSWDELLTRNQPANPAYA